MRYHLYKKTELHVTGDPTDESERSATETSFFVVKATPEEEDRLGEHIVSECGDQDYSWQVDFKKLGTFEEDELLEIKDAIENRNEV